jgi:acyl carrier protein
MITVSVEEKIQAIISRMLYIDISKVTPDALLVEDLGADSLDIIEIIMEIEEAFDIYEIPDKDLERINTVQGIVECVKKELGTRYQEDKKMMVDEGIIAEPETVEDRSTFELALENLINRYSIENESDTPDFILAQYLRACLDAFKVAVRERDRWYGLRTLEGGTAKGITREKVYSD